MRVLLLLSIIVVFCLLLISCGGQDVVINVGRQGNAEKRGAVDEVNPVIDAVITGIGTGDKGGMSKDITQ